MNIKLAAAITVITIFCSISGTYAERVGQTINIAHRGARSVAPENTLHALYLALAKFDADMAEVDVHLTKDGIPVVIHDDTLERCSNVAEMFPERMPWRIADFTMAEIATLDAGSWFVREDPFGQIAAGKVPQDDINLFLSGSVRIPTLKSVLKMLKGFKRPINLEIKNFPAYYPDIASKVVKEVRDAEISDWVIFSSFDHEILHELKVIAPDIPRAVLAEQPIYPLEPYCTDTLGAFAYNPSLDVLGFSSSDYLKNGRFRIDIINKAIENDLAVFVWTVNDPKIMQQLLDAGISGIFTDFPQILSVILKKSRNH